MRQWAIAVAVLCAARFSSAGVLLYEPFNYAPRQVLAGQVAPNGQAWETASANINDDDISVLEGSLSHAGLPASQGNSVIYSGTGKTQRVALAPSPLVQGTVYYSLLIQVFSPAPATPVFVAGFNNRTGSQVTQPTTIGARLYLKQSDAGDGFQIGVSKNSSIAADISLDGGDHPFAQTLLVVGSYEIVNDQATGTDDIARIWVEPDVATFGAANAPTATITAPIIGPDLGVGGFPSVASFILRQGNQHVPSVQVDELRVGTTWADVTGASSPAVPLPLAVWGGLIGICVIACSQEIIARRRAVGRLCLG